MPLPLLVLAEWMLVFGIDRGLARHAQIEKWRGRRSAVRSLAVLSAYVKNSVCAERGDHKDAECRKWVRAHFDHPECDEKNERDETGGPPPEIRPEWRRRDEAGEIEEDCENEKKLKKSV